MHRCAPGDHNPSGELLASGMPYVPGSVSGVLRQAAEPYGAADILILVEHDIGRLPTLPAGFVVVDGAPLSHTMIRLMGSGRPTVIVTAAQAARLTPGSRVLLDGGAGRLIPAPDPAARPDGGQRPPSPDRPLTTADGTRVHLLASVRSGSAAAQARTQGAEAIGLVRSEFLSPPDGRQPDGPFYRRAFHELGAAAAPLPVTIRLLDLAPDKLPAWLGAAPDLGGVLGLQGVRLFGTEPVRSVVQAQLSALQQVQREFPMRVLLPYLVRQEELQHWLAVVRRQLPASVPVGAMVETPAAALDLGNWLDDADFVALGCNDLMQCFFAADRDRPQLRGYLDPYAPPLYRLLQQVAQAAGGRLQQVQLCGVLAQLPGVLPLLLGLGYRNFSVEVALLPHLADSARGADLAACEHLAARVCVARTSREVLRLLGLPFEPYQPFLA